VKGLGHLPPIGALAVLLALVLLGGCASVRSLSSDVSSFSHWPTERRPTTYAFERLPSQQVRPEQQQQLEDAARSAVEAAGFAPAGDPKGADVTVQVGVRVTALDRSPFYDPFWYGPRLSIGFGWGYGYPRYGGHVYHRGGGGGGHRGGRGGRH